jgi:hypothetical protein
MLAGSVGYANWIGMGIKIEQGLLVALSAVVVWLGWQQYGRRLKRWWGGQREHLPRHWHAKSAADCPQCRVGVGLRVV